MPHKKEVKIGEFLVQASNEDLTTPTGLVLVGELLRLSGLQEIVNDKKLGKRSKPYIKIGDTLASYIAMLCQAKPCYDDIRELHANESFSKKALHIEHIPSSEALRLRMNNIGGALHQEILMANIQMLVKSGVMIPTEKHGYVVIDIDVSCFDNSKTFKEGVSRTYAGYDGYAPIFAYIAHYLLDAELRIGVQHCQNGTPAFLLEALIAAHKITEKTLLVRLDSGNDAAENIGILLTDHTHFIIKRNLRRESVDEWAVQIKESCKNIDEPRDGKKVYTGSLFKEVTYTIKEDNKDTDVTVPVRIVYEMTVRTIDKYGQTLLVPEIELDMWWTDLDWNEDDVIESYHAHGECEQYHSEIKTDMDVERLPSGKLETNKLVLDLTILAFNILRIIGDKSLEGDSSPQMKRPVERRRIRTVISNLILIASHLTSHARRRFVSLGRSNIWIPNFLNICSSIAAM